MDWLFNLLKTGIHLISKRNKPPLVEIFDNKSNKVKKRINIVMADELSNDVRIEDFLRGTLKFRNIGEPFRIEKVLINNKEIKADTYVLFDEICEIYCIQKFEYDGLFSIKEIALELSNEHKTRFLCHFDVIYTGLKYEFAFKEIKKKKLKRVVF